MPDEKALEAAHKIFWDRMAKNQTVTAQLWDAFDAGCRAYAAALPSPATTEPSEDEGIKVALNEYFEARMQTPRNPRPYSDQDLKLLQRLDYTTKKVFDAITAWAGRSATKEPTDAERIAQLERQLNEQIADKHRILREYEERLKLLRGQLKLRDDNAS